MLGIAGKNSKSVVCTPIDVHMHLLRNIPAVAVVPELPVEEGSGRPIISHISATTTKGVAADVIYTS